MMTAIACEVRAKEASPLLKFIGNPKGVADGKAKNGVIELLVVRGNLLYHLCTPVVFPIAISALL